VIHGQSGRLAEIECQNYWHWPYGTRGKEKQCETNKREDGCNCGGGRCHRCVIGGTFVQWRMSRRESRPANDQVTREQSQSAASQPRPAGREANSTSSHSVTINGRRLSDQDIGTLTRTLRCRSGMQLLVRPDERRLGAARRTDGGLHYGRSQLWWAIAGGRFPWRHGCVHQWPQLHGWTFHA